MPPRPPVVQGCLYQVGFVFASLYRKYMVLNPHLGYLAICKNEEHWPQSPQQIIPLIHISHVNSVD